MTIAELSVEPGYALCAPAADSASGAAYDLVRRLYRTQARSVFQFLRRLLRDSSLAHDALQETFVRALTAFQRLHDPSRARAWLFGIARHVASEFRRGESRLADGADLADSEEAASDKPTPEESAIDHELVGALQTALNEMTEDRRTALILRAEHGLRYREIAIAMKWSVSKAKIEVMRARRAIRARLSEVGGPDEM